MAIEAKTEKLLVRMGRTEASMLTQLCEKSGLTRADVLRQLIRREHGATFGDAHDRSRAKPKHHEARRRAGGR